jgi:hypothetical protein|tara:strand:+ start:1134 stop:1379 length:246 start_codon:yes stop_codon:yes gene_type:complete
MESLNTRKKAVRQNSNRGVKNWRMARPGVMTELAIFDSFPTELRKAIRNATRRISPYRLKYEMAESGDSIEAVIASIPQWR